MKKKRSADFCADQIDVITNFAVIMNVIIKRVHVYVLLSNYSLHCVQTNIYSIFH